MSEIILFLFKKKREIACHTVSGRRVEQPRANGSILYRGKVYLSFPKYFDKEWGPTILIFNGEWNSIPGSKWPELEADKLPKSVLI